ncbi:UNVERIFIED_CONTAM: hypothetical protein Sindi_2013400 [Sesamum indicum]
MKPNESSSYSENRKYFQILEIQRREFLMEILDKCYNGRKRIDPRLLTPEEEKEWLRNFEVRQVLLGNAVRSLHSTEVHGRIPTRRSGMDIKIQIGANQERPWNSTSSTPEGKGYGDSKAKYQRRCDYHIYQIHKIMEVTTADLSDLQELAESFSQLGIVDLVNIQTNKITPALPPPEGSTCSNDPPQDQLMRESSDFHTNATPTFVGTRLKENPGRNPKRVLEYTPWARTMLQPLHPYGAILNLDITDFRNTEKLIDEWVAAIKIAAATLELDKKNFIKLVELSLEGSVKIGWDNIQDTKVSILVGDSKGAIADQLGRLIKIHFIGDGYFEGSKVETTREYAQALLSLELRSICTWSSNGSSNSNVLRKYMQSMVENENQASRGKGGSKIVTLTPGVPEEPFPDRDHGGPNPKPEHINLDRKQDQQGFHLKDLDEQMQDPLKELL